MTLENPSPCVLCGILKVDNELSLFENISSMFKNLFKYSLPIAALIYGSMWIFDNKYSPEAKKKRLLERMNEEQKQRKFLAAGIGDGSVQEIYRNELFYQIRQAQYHVNRINIEVTKLKTTVNQFIKNAQRKDDKEIEFPPNHRNKRRGTWTQCSSSSLMNRRFNAFEEFEEAMNGGDHSVQSSFN